MKQITKALAALVMVTLLSSAASLSAETKKTVLFDEGHSQKFLVEQNGPLDLSGLSTLFQREGLSVRTNRGKITAEVLAGVDALVISGAFAPVDPSEIAVISRFLENGGRLCIMLHIGQPVSDLLRRVNVAISNGVIHEYQNPVQNNGLDFYVTRLKPHDLMKGVERFRVYGGWALLATGGNAEIIAQTSTEAWVDLNRDNKFGDGDAVQSFGLVVAGKLGRGRFVVFGDDALFQNRYLVGGNAVLGKNLAGWLRDAKGAEERTPKSSI